MQFTLSKDREHDVWNIRPTSGAFESVLVATAEQVNLKHVVFEGKTMIGTIKALWGVTVLCEDVYEDPQTLRALSLGKFFDTNLEETLTLDYDGYLSGSKKVCIAAKRVLATRQGIYARGVE